MTDEPPQDVQWLDDAEAGDLSANLPTMESVYVERREPRASTNWIGMIHLSDGTEIPCTVKDVSRSGAKLGVPAAVDLPLHFMLRVIGHEFVCSVRLAWRQGNYAGLAIKRIGKLAQVEKVVAPATEPLPAAPAPALPRAAGSHRSLGSRRNRSFTP